ncbi:hypothetical protein Tsubulata_026447 [Turnera subulata]|uniref:Uncharacterized protein n=1 Tax=Turnera subulata TaxID=218843 RepID=A0A9Q0JFF9_9ROSI|nr:hypothetical protein Tsubulata_026447 [Turnera subulata]
MVRFSCFHAHTPCHKPKKTDTDSTEGMKKSLEDSSLIQAPKASNKARSLNLFLKARKDTLVNNGEKDVASSASIERGWKSDEIKGKMNIENEIGVHPMGFLRKTQSLGSGLCNEGQAARENDMEEYIDQEYSSDSIDHNRLTGQDSSKNPGMSPSSEHQKALPSESVQLSSGHVNKESIFLIDDPQNSEKEDLENSDNLSSGRAVNDCGSHAQCAAPRLVKSPSMPNLGSWEGISGGCSSKNLLPRSRTLEDLHALDMRHKEISVHQVDLEAFKREHNDNTTKKCFESYCDDGYDSYNYSASAKEWVMPATDVVNLDKTLQGEPSVQQWDELPGQDFKFKRIQEWVDDLQHCSPTEETNGLSDTNEPLESDSNNLKDLTAAKIDQKVTPGMEAAKRYISSLSISATTAQLSNHGLAVIPFLSAFGSLKLLNLSGNAIVRITAGALPRGLHTLNLSKNKISAIEGLRELTRLRVLDLSYNRIIRIGHGLASCSSLKELYLAGNKVSEVEGLHRLLKLAVLDLRFNKISTAKCLGQLAANYNSLQAISLEGNPAQKNVGDEQLKKYVQGLLPHLVYFNRQPIKVSTLKDSADRAVRLGMGSHQFDRGHRSDNKALRKVGHGLAAAKSSSSLTHLRKSQATVSPKRTKGRHGHLPPTGSKATANHNNHYLDLGTKLLNFRAELAIRRSRSEGTLAAI